MERFFDILFSGIALITLSPILIIVSGILKFTGESEVFFMQKRIGKNGKTFNLMKFATMLKDSPNIGTGTVTVKNDPRVLPFGHFLRKTKINELPQLMNIFLGDMSIIGPRPLTIQTFSFYTIETQKIITKVRPGLSGIGSIIFRNEEDIMQGVNASISFYNNNIAPYKGNLEVWFVKNKSLWVYFAAIFITILIVVFPSSKIVWRVFETLPPPPEDLKKILFKS
jgi:lipopolysaccharide/colanic/teichoic acid biosynthesis glycosyltransferase